MDAMFIRNQIRKRWKQHAVIIKRLTCKSKQQLQLLKNNYNKSIETGGQGRNIVNDVREMLGGPYGEFIRSNIILLNVNNNFVFVYHIFLPYCYCFLDHY